MIWTERVHPRIGIAPACGAYGGSQTKGEIREDGRQSNPVARFSLEPSRCGENESSSTNLWYRGRACHPGIPVPPRDEEHSFSPLGCILEQTSWVSREQTNCLGARRLQRKLEEHRVTEDKSPRSPIDIPSLDVGQLVTSGFDYRETYNRSAPDV